MEQNDRLYVKFALPSNGDEYKKIVSKDLHLFLCATGAMSSTATYYMRAYALDAAFDEDTITYETRQETTKSNAGYSFKAANMPVTESGRTVYFPNEARFGIDITPQAIGNGWVEIATTGENRPYLTL